MSKAEIVPHIRRAWEYSTAMGIGELFSMPVALVASEEFKSVALDPESSYEDVYLLGIHLSQYNILLNDFSFFQFGSSTGDTEEVRFAFYPNPFLGADPDSVAELHQMREFVSEGIIDIEELLHRISEIRRPQHPPLVRYEYSKEQYKENSHPCSHIHMGFHGGNRWPVKRYLSAHAFSLLIFRLFYLESWMAAAPIKAGGKETTLDLMLQTARAESRVLYADEFSDAEERRFYLV